MLAYTIVSSCASDRVPFCWISYNIIIPVETLARLKFHGESQNFPEALRGARCPSFLSLLAFLLATSLGFETVGSKRHD